MLPPHIAHGKSLGGTNCTLSVTKAANQCHNSSSAHSTRRSTGGINNTHQKWMPTTFRINKPYASSLPIFSLAMAMCLQIPLHHAETKTLPEPGRDPGHVLTNDKRQNFTHTSAHCPTQSANKSLGIFFKVTLVLGGRWAEDLFRDAAYKVHQSTGQRRIRSSCSNDSIWGWGAYTAHPDISLTVRKSVMLILIILFLLTILCSSRKNK